MTGIRTYTDVNTYIHRYTPFSSVVMSVSPSSCSGLSSRLKTMMTSLFILVVLVCLMCNECFGFKKNRRHYNASNMKVLGRKARWGHLAMDRIGVVSTPSMLQMTDTSSTDTIVSPFAPGDGEAVGSGDIGDDYELELTRENVELVLDEMRPFLKADGYDGLLLIE